MDYLDNLFQGEEIKYNVRKYFKNIDTDEKVQEMYNLVIKYVSLKDLEKFIKIAKPILNNKEYLKRIDFPHHSEESVAEHSIKVASLAYKMSNYLSKVNSKDVVIAGLLHDFYTTPWQNNKEKTKFLKQHGFIHASVALNNSKEFFPNLMSERIEDAIKTHMFPLNIRRPKYKESWLITAADKYVSMSVFKDVKRLPSYIGIKQIER